MTVVIRPLPSSATSAGAGAAGSAAGEGRSLMRARGCTTELRPEEPLEQVGAGASADWAGAASCCAAAERAGWRDGREAAMVAGRPWVHTDPSSPTVSTQPESGRMSTCETREERGQGEASQEGLDLDAWMVHARSQNHANSWPRAVSRPSTRVSAHLGDGRACHVGLAGPCCAGCGLAAACRQAVQEQRAAVGGHCQQRERGVHCKGGQLACRDRAEKGC